MLVHVCPRCKLEFSAQFDVCALCLKPLEPAAEEDSDPWVVIATTRNLVDAEALLGALVSSGIHAISEERGVAMYPSPDGGLSLCLVRVPLRDLEAALEFKDQAERGEWALEDGDPEEQG